MTRNRGYTEEHMEEHDTSLEKNTARNNTVSPQVYCPSAFKTACAKPLTQLSRMPSKPLTKEVLLSALSEEYKCTAPAMLCMLEDMLNYFSKSNFILPQEILNILSYSWKEVIKGVCCHKKSWQGLACSKVKLGTKQTTSEHINYKMAENVKSPCRISAVVSTGVLKEEKNHETVLKRLPGNNTAVSQEHARNVPGAISFSLASELCEERANSELPFHREGWVFQCPDSRDPEWKESYTCAVKKLQKDKIQITSQLCKLKDTQCEKPIILRHYEDVRKGSLLKNLRGSTVSSEVLDENLQVPANKQTKPFFKKQRYRLVDGPSFIYYPSGHFAVCQSHSDLPGGGMYTNIFNDFPDGALLGTFTPFGCGSIYFPSSNNIALIFNQEGGMVTKKDGEMPRQWKWPGAEKLNDPVIVWVNKFITVKIEGRFAIWLVYKWQHESARLSLSPTQSVAVPYLENLDQALADAKLSSKAIKEFSKMHSKTLRDKEAKKSQRKGSKLPKMTKIPGSLEDDLIHFKDFKATGELRILQQKIKNILENWMEYYWIAFGISSPRPGQTITFPERPDRHLKKRFASLDLQMAQGREEKKKDTEASVSEHPPQFQSATVCNLIQKVSSGAFRVPQLWNSSSKTNQPVRIPFNGKKDEAVFQLIPKARENTWCSSHAACPAALRRMMLGNEGKICRCNSHQIPYVTDLEYSHIVNNQVSSPEQITVVCVISSQRATGYDPNSDKHLDQLYERMNKNRSMPCAQGRLDSFRLLKYDIDSADEFTDRCGALLVKRHNIAAGMILMYIHGKLLFANYIFNGYSRSAKDLQKQIELTRSSYNRGYYLPTDYRFSSLEKTLHSSPDILNQDYQIL